MNLKIQRIKHTCLYQQKFDGNKEISVLIEALYVSFWTKHLSFYDSSAFRQCFPIIP